MFVNSHLSSVFYVTPTVRNSIPEERGRSQTLKSQDTQIQNKGSWITELAVLRSDRTHDTSEWYQYHYRLWQFNWMYLMEKSALKK